MPLVAWYRLEDKVASTYVEDGSGNGYNATAKANELAKHSVPNL